LLLFFYKIRLPVTNSSWFKLISLKLGGISYSFIQSMTNPGYFRKLVLTKNSDQKFCCYLLTKNFDANFWPNILTKFFNQNYFIQNQIVSKINLYWPQFWQIIMTNIMNFQQLFWSTVLTKYFDQKFLSNSLTKNVYQILCTQFLTTYFD